jgi:hypothetical protein
MYRGVNVNLVPFSILYPSTQKLGTKQPNQVSYICFHIHVINNKCNKKSMPCLMALREYEKLVFVYDITNYVKDI